MSRLDFVKGNATKVSAGTALTALHSRWNMVNQADFADDIEVLNFALLLEHLEAGYYDQGNRAVQLGGFEFIYMKQVERDEKFHVELLSDTIRELGGTPVEAPELDFGDAFRNRQSYLELSHTFENTGVGAYLGAAGFLEDRELLQAAAAIFGNEARHAAVVGELLGLPAENGVYMSAFETPIPKDDVEEAIGPFIPDL